MHVSECTAVVSLAVLVFGVVCSVPFIPVIVDFVDFVWKCNRRRAAVAITAGLAVFCISFISIKLTPCKEGSLSKLMKDIPIQVVACDCGQ